MAFPVQLCAQSILTVAGGGTDDGRPATVAGLSFPSGAALDVAGNLYIADAGGNRVRRVAAASGLITTVAGSGSGGLSGDGGPATAAQLSYPRVIAVDRTGNLYIGDTYNSRIRKVTAGSGIITTVAGNGSSQYGGDGGQATAASFYPAGVAVDTAGNLYISGNSRVRMVSATSGIITTVAGNGAAGANGLGTFSGDGAAATAAGLSSTPGVAVDVEGNTYIADMYNHRIRRIDAATGIITTIAGNGATDASGRGGFSGDGGVATLAALNYPQGVAIDPAGNLYVADTLNSRIRKIAKVTGTITTVAGNGGGFGGDGAQATAAGLNEPLGIATDPSGNLYVADTFNYRVRPVTAGNGVITTVAGNGLGFTGDNGPATAAGLAHPAGVAIDGAGNLYIADGDNHRIRRVAAGSGIISTIAGTGSASFKGDGAAATAAGLNRPTGVIVDSRANLYIADTNNSRVRRISSETGIITTVAGNGSYVFKGDGVPATEAALNPDALSLDALGNLYIADSYNSRVYRVSEGSGIIQSVAGNGSYQSSGDGGPATVAGLDPKNVAVDAAGNLYIADYRNNRVRKVAVDSGTITTIAMPGLNGPNGIAFDLAGNLYISDLASIHRVDSATGAATVVAGNGTRRFSGDTNAATAAGFSECFGVTVDHTGNLYSADRSSNRVRAVFACVGIASPSLQQPANGSASVPAGPRLTWSATKGAFSYDVYLDTVNPPALLAAPDVAAPVYAPSNLEPLTTYYWQVVAKGDQFCVPVSSARSEVFSFTTQGQCRPPAPFNGSNGANE